ncbi:hypothetical protein [Frankia sp. CiP1_Cm_nod1]|uniref:hypothetical protein n=1 Tax=Frankia sp. CiP1_Cm_nod1 TaxID=2897160 RepID=UPI002023FE06
MPVRPTLRCLREDLHLPLPPASVPLDQVGHPLLAKAGEQFADPDTPHERIRSAVILSRVPGCATDGWFPEHALPERHLLPAEQAWSNLMDPKAAAHLLDDQD